MGPPIDRKAQMCQFSGARKSGLGPSTGRVARKGAMGHRFTNLKTHFHGSLSYMHKAFKTYLLLIKVNNTWQSLQVSFDSHCSGSSYDRDYPKHLWLYWGLKHLVTTHQQSLNIVLEESSACFLAVST